MLKFETNEGHVELELNGEELRLEHEHGKFTKRITFDRKETKEILKLLKKLEANK